MIDAHVTARRRGGRRRARVAAIVVAAGAVGIGLGALVHGSLAPGTARHGSGATLGLRGQATWAARSAAGARDRLVARSERAPVRAHRASRPHGGDDVPGLPLPPGVSARGSGARGLGPSAAGGGAPSARRSSASTRVTPRHRSARRSATGVSPAGVPGTGSPASTRSSRACGARITSSSPPGRGDIVHTEAVYLIDRAGRRTLRIPVPVPPGVVCVMTSGSSPVRRRGRV